MFNTRQLNLIRLALQQWRKDIYTLLPNSPTDRITEHFKQQLKDIDDIDDIIDDQQ